MLGFPLTCCFLQH
ncbi:hypothetical protein VCHENC02_2292A, partial [Vibrio harveyi]